MKTKKLKRSEFDEYISHYSVMNLLNCLCELTIKESTILEGGLKKPL